MRGAIPGQVVLGSIRKQDEQAMRNKPVSSKCFCGRMRHPSGICPGVVELDLEKDLPEELPY